MARRPTCFILVEICPSFSLMALEISPRFHIFCTLPFVPIASHALRTVNASSLPPSSFLAEWGRELFILLGLASPS